MSVQPDRRSTGPLTGDPSGAPGPGPSWVAGPPLNVPRGGLAGADVGGVAYAAGGWSSTSFDHALGDVERLDSTGTTWRRVESMPTPRGNPAAAGLAGRLFVLGGYPPLGTGPAHDVVEIYHPAQDSWVTGPRLPRRVGSGAAASLAGRLYLAGGDDGSDSAAPSRAMLVLDGDDHGADDATRQWHQVAPMPTGRALLKLQALAGHLYAIGGVGEDGLLSSVERYDPHADAWHAVRPMTRARGNPGVTAVAGRIVVVAGAGPASGPGSDAPTTAEIYDPAADRWQVLRPSLEPGRVSLIAATLAKNTVIAVAGFARTPGGALEASSRVDALRIDH